MTFMNDLNIYQPRISPRVSYPTVRGLRHRLFEWGDREAEPVFYLHGWGDTAATFQLVVDAFKSGRRVIAYDWRGFGETDRSGPLYWFPEYLADLEAMLAAHSPDRPVTLIGHSMGANVAALYAGARSDRVRAFINLEGFGLPDGEATDVPDHYRRWLDRLASPSRFATYQDFDELVERIIQRSPRLGLPEARFVARAWAEEVAPGEIRLKADADHRLPNAVMYRRAEAEACWRAIRGQVLLVAGAKTHFRAGIEDWFHEDPAERPFPGAELTVIEECGHMMHFEAPAAVAGIIEEFLDDL